MGVLGPGLRSLIIHIFREVLGLSKPQASLSLLPSPLTPSHEFISLLLYFFNSVFIPRCFLLNFPSVCSLASLPFSSTHIKKVCEYAQVQIKASEIRNLSKFIYIHRSIYVELKLLHKSIRKHFKEIIKCF